MTEHIWRKISEIIPNRLYLSGLGGAESINQINNLKIDTIVSVTDFIPFKHSKLELNKKIEFIHFYAEDKESFNIAQYFDKFNKLMDNFPNKIILIHCLAGMSRSATIVIAYILYKQMAQNVKSAIKFVQNKREWIKPNDGFIVQLKEWDKSLKKL